MPGMRWPLLRVPNLLACCLGCIQFVSCWVHGSPSSRAKWVPGPHPSSAGGWRCQRVHLSLSLVAWMTGASSLTNVCASEPCTRRVLTGTENPSTQPGCSTGQRTQVEDPGYYGLG